MAGTKQNSVQREFFTLGEHAIGSRRFRFRYDGRVYHILERQVNDEGEDVVEERLLLEEADARKAYDTWNRLKRPERYGG